MIKKNDDATLSEHSDNVRDTGDDLKVLGRLPKDTIGKLESAIADSEVYIRTHHAILSQGLLQEHLTDVVAQRDYILDSFLEYAETFYETAVKSLAEVAEDGNDFSKADNDLLNACLSIAGSKAVSLISELGLPPVPPEQIQDKVKDVSISLRLRWRHMREEFVAAAWQRKKARLTESIAQEIRSKGIGANLLAFHSAVSEAEEETTPEAGAQSPSSDSVKGRRPTNHTKTWVRIENFLRAVSIKANRQITKKLFWRAANYSDPTEFERFQRGARVSERSTQRFERLLALSPEAFLNELQKRGLLD